MFNSLTSRPLFNAWQRAICTRRSCFLVACNSDLSETTDEAVCRCEDWHCYSRCQHVNSHGFILLLDVYIYMYIVSDLCILYIF